MTTAAILFGLVFLAPVVFVGVPLAKSEDRFQTIPLAKSEDRCPHGMFFSGAGACPQCGKGAE